MVNTPLLHYNNSNNITLTWYYAVINVEYAQLMNISCIHNYNTLYLLALYNLQSREIRMIKPPRMVPSILHHLCPQEINYTGHNPSI